MPKGFASRRGPHYQVPEYIKSSIDRFRKRKTGKYYDRRTKKIITPARKRELQRGIKRNAKLHRVHLKVLIVYPDKSFKEFRNDWRNFVRVVEAKRTELAQRYRDTYTISRADAIYIYGLTHDMRKPHRGMEAALLKIMSRPYTMKEARERAKFEYKAEWPTRKLPESYLPASVWEKYPGDEEIASILESEGDDA
jgi:hypothetical protein